MLPLSVITLTYNSERTIEMTLKSVSEWVKEIIVIDSGSRDKTIEIAQKYNCRIIKKDFKGFGEQKAYGVDIALNDWVMIVDSDEVVTDGLKKEIDNNLENTDYSGFEIPITLVFMGKIMKGHENKMLHLRLFNKKYGNYNDALVHEDIILKGKIGKLENEIFHYSYGDLHEYFFKFNSYTTKAAEDLFKKGKHVNTFGIVARFPLQFFQSYFIHLNVLNGYPGFIWALCSSFYPVIKYAKLKELIQKKDV